MLMSHTLSNINKLNLQFMKNIKLLSMAFLLLIIYTANAQTSQRGFSFQGYAVNSQGVTLSNKHIDLKFTIYSKNGAGYTYEEVQNDVTCDFYGIVHAVVGEKTPALFQKMNFTAKGADYWMLVEVREVGDPLYNTISDQAMLAAPYARFADNGVPVGTVISFGADTSKVPEGWLLCDGTEYDGTDPRYERLYNVLENTWGGSSTNFNVPDFRGYFLRGFDNGAGTDPEAAGRTALIAGGNSGDAIGSYQTSGVKAHHHYLNATTSSAGNHSHSIGAYYGSNIAASSTNSDYCLYNADGSYIGTTTATAGAHTHPVTGNTDNNTDLETRPKNAYVLYIIKY